GIDAAELQSIRDSETVGKNLPNFPTVFRYRCVHYPYFSAALADGHTLINHLIKREQNKFTWSAERENGQI
ncbi:MAG: hypothetical protein J6E43_04715, partial [Prevotella sp.]|nr:hypothetical protein [Prevotella sp.]